MLTSRHHGSHLSSMINNAVCSKRCLGRLSLLASFLAGFVLAALERDGSLAFLLPANTGYGMLNQEFSMHIVCHSMKEWKHAEHQDNTQTYMLRGRHKHHDEVSLCATISTDQ